MLVVHYQFISNNYLRLFINIQSFLHREVLFQHHFQFIPLNQELI